MSKNVHPVPTPTLCKVKEVEINMNHKVVYYESRKRDLKKEWVSVWWKTKNCEVVYYESRKREIKIRLMNEGRCDERLKDRVEESTCLAYTGLHDKTK
jgi:hypothetical protein